MKAPKSHVCVICGVRPATTVDHVPPKGFFKGLINAQLKTVPACRVCNNGASSDDEDVRFFISAQIGKQNPGSKALWEEGAYKSIQRKTRLREAFVATTREVKVVEANGKATTRLAFNFPVQPYQRVFERTTRGLYFFHTERILPADVPVLVQMLTAIPNMNSEEFLALQTHSVGGGACVYRYGISAEDAFTSVWIYEFHQAHWAMATTGAVRQ